MTRKLHPEAYIDALKKIAEWLSVELPNRMPQLTEPPFEPVGTILLAAESMQGVLNESRRVHHENTMLVNENDGRLDEMRLLEHQMQEREDASIDKGRVLEAIGYNARQVDVYSDDEIIEQIRSMR